MEFLTQSMEKAAPAATVGRVQRELYIPCLDGIRAIAFILVFVAHAGAGKFVPGGFGVTVFFFLSGYLITTLLRLEAAQTGDISLKQFYIRRAFRILPPMYITLGVAFLMAALGWVAERGNLAGVGAALFYLNNYYGLLKGTFGLPKGMEVIWSLAVEEHFYFVFPVLYLLFLRQRIAAKKQATILAAACLLALLWRCVLVFGLHISLESAHPWTYIATDCRFDSILLGCLLAIRNNPSFSDSSPLLVRYKGRAALLGLLLIIFSLLIRNPQYRESLRYTLQSVALYPIFFYCLTSTGAWLVKLLEWRPLRWIGWLSYTLYLIHFVLLRHFQDYNYPGQPWKSGTIALLLSLVYAWMMREAVERPLRRLRNKLVHVR